jgi:hypothetical protein
LRIQQQQQQQQQMRIGIPDEVWVYGKVLDGAVQEEVVHKAERAVGQIVEH